MKCKTKYNKISLKAGSLERQIQYMKMKKQKRKRAQQFFKAGDN